VARPTDNPVLMAKKHDFQFIGKADSCEFTKDGVTYLTSILQHDMYLLDFTIVTPNPQVYHGHLFGNIHKTQEYQSLQKWHNRLGHLNFDMIKKMAKSGSIHSLKLATQDPDHLCTGCQYGKHQRSSFSINSPRQRSKFPGQLIHADICGPMSTPSIGRSLYYILFKDDATRFTFVFCVPHKSEVLNCFQQVCRTILWNTGKEVQVLRTDRGGEFANKAFDKFLNDNFIKREFTALYTP
jgi:hypothetical protein